MYPDIIFVYLYPQISIGFALASSPPEGDTSCRSQNIQDALPVDMLLHVAEASKSASRSFNFESH
jgi:hypothetical protein